MNIRRVLAVAAIPFVIGTFGFAAPDQANAQTRSNRIAQITERPNRPEDGLQKPDDKPHDKHRKPRPHQKKRQPQRPGERPAPPPPNR